MNVATTKEIRKSFPALERKHDRKRVAYFDAPGGTQVPRPVADAITDYLFHHNANTHWAYPTSEETDAIILAAREAMADFLGASSREIAFGANMTTLAFHLGRALARTWAPGDEVVVTELDHHANVAPWRALEVDRGIIVRSVRMNPETAQVDYDHLAQIVKPRTKLVAIGGASNAVGTINDLSRAREIARGVGALMFVDAVHLAPHELIDVRELGCDFLACSSYKFYGPHAGVLYAREELMAELPFPKLAPAPDTAPERAETGTQNQEGIAGIAATVDFLASLANGSGSRREKLAASFEALHERGALLIAAAWSGLSSMKHVRLFGPDLTMRRTPTLAFTVTGMTAEEVSRRLAREGLFASHGDFYAMTAIERFGVEALVRIGCACYTNEEEIERLLEAVDALAT